MALMNLAATRVAVSSPPRGSVNHATTAHRHRTHNHRTWYRATIEAAGTFFVLAGIAVGILTLRFALVLIHGVMH